MTTDDLLDLGRTRTAEVFDEGFAARRSKDEFNRDFRDLGDLMMGAVWAREGLALRLRRLITMSVLATLRLPAQLSMHFEAALEKGEFTPAELEEFLLQIGFYAGIPAASTANGALRAVIEKRAASSG